MVGGAILHHRSRQRIWLCRDRLSCQNCSTTFEEARNPDGLPGSLEDCLQLVGWGAVEATAHPSGLQQRLVTTVEPMQAVTPRSHVHGDRVREWVRQAGPPQHQQEEAMGSRSVLVREGREERGRQRRGQRRGSSDSYGHALRPTPKEADRRGTIGGRRAPGSLEFEIPARVSSGGVPQSASSLWSTHWSTGPGSPVGRRGKPIVRRVGRVAAGFCVRAPSLRGGRPCRGVRWCR
jgi:hypothetical protein